MCVLRRWPLFGSNIVKFVLAAGQTCVRYG